MASANVPMDILKDILIQLPVKSLIRFKCVCKAWHDLIESSDFIKSNLNRSIETNSNCSLIVVRNFVKYYYQIHGLHRFFTTTKLSLPQNELFSRYNIEVIGSCNGLICVRWDDINCLALWNPSIRSFKKVSTIWELDATSYGFGYDGERDDYKIVTFLGDPDGSNLCDYVFVYSMRDDSWSQADPPDLHVFDHLGIERGTFMNNHLHWVCEGGIYRFDIHDNRWTTILVLPDDVTEYRYDLRLRVFDGCLCLLIYYTFDYDVMDTFEMWVMTEYGKEESWTKLLVSFPDDWGIPLIYSQNRSSVLFSKGKTCSLFWYNLYEKTIEEVKLEDVPEWDVHIRSDLIFYMESLVQPRG